MTSALKTANLTSRTVITESGRVYELDAGPANDPQIIGVLMAWTRLELRDDCKDVGSEIWNQMLRSAQ
jgi:hypothetical protein